MAQVNGISTALKGSFNIPGVVTGIVVCALIAVIIYGGLKRIVTVTEKFVPFMAAFYIIGALIIIIVNFRHIGDAFGEIFSGRSVCAPSEEALWDTVFQEPCVSVWRAEYFLMRRASARR